jgi:restriction system protein
MFGVLQAPNAMSVDVVSSGHFTKDAIKFAQDLPIELINGEQLIKLIADVQTTKPLQASVKPIAKQIQLHAQSVLRLW